MMARVANGQCGKKINKAKEGGSVGKKRVGRKSAAFTDRSSCGATYQFFVRVGSALRDDVSLVGPRGKGKG